jgi:hypothetical protein
LIKRKNQSGKRRVFHGSSFAVSNQKWMRLHSRRSAEFNLPLTSNLACHFASTILFVNNHFQVREQRVMHFEISLAANGQYGIVKVNAPMTHALATEQLKVIKELTARTGAVNFLIDLRESQFIESVGTHYVFANDTLDRFQMQRANRFALVVAPDDYSHNFLEVASNNAGFNLKIFRDYQQAVDWLMK